MLLVNFRSLNRYETILSMLELKMEDYSSLVIIWRAFSILAKSVTSPQTKKGIPMAVNSRVHRNSNYLTKNGSSTVTALSGQSSSQTPQYQHSSYLIYGIPRSSNRIMSNGQRSTQTPQLVQRFVSTFSGIISRSSPGLLGTLHGF